MDELRKSVQNAAYEQKDPLVIYKIEAFELWKKMLWELNTKVVSTLMRGRLAVMDYAEAKAAEEARRQAEMQEEEARRRNAVYMRQPAGGISQQAGRVNAPNPYAGYSTTHETYEGENAQREAARNVNRPAAPKQPVKADPKIGRNDPCPCGSGKKYKNCCGRDL